MNQEEEILGNVSRESDVLHRRRNVRRQSTAIFNAFEDITNHNRGLLDEQELAVGDEDIVIPIGGRVTNLLGSESSSWEAKVEPKYEGDLPNLPNPDLQDQYNHLGSLRNRIPSEEDSLLMSSISSLDDDTWLLPVPEVNGEKSSRVGKKSAIEAKGRDVRGIYLRKPSRLQPPSTGRLRGDRKQAAERVVSSRVQQEQTKEEEPSEKESPFTRHLKFLEEHPEIAFSASQNLPEDRSLAEIKRKTSLERHLELWGISRLPSLDEKKL
ncbi:hypothetical protein M9435_006647 [Picochlorum sp. BPE23]|nr:hypothetical protein M9435_006647 [Picochlorum sp. BPE23]